MKKDKFTYQTDCTKIFKRFFGDVTGTSRGRDRDVSERRFQI